MSLNRINVPKNILATSMNGGTHLPRILEVLKFLMERGYNVTLISPGNYTARSIHYRSIPQVIFANEYLERELPSAMNNVFNEDDYFKSFSTLKSTAVQSYLPFYNIYEKVAKEINADLF
ncbi:34247_t:CDS:2, partial [Racocetra persica]